MTSSWSSFFIGDHPLILIILFYLWWLPPPNHCFLLLDHHFLLIIIFGCWSMPPPNYHLVLLIDCLMIITSSWSSSYCWSLFCYSSIIVLLFFYVCFYIIFINHETTPQSSPLPHLHSLMDQSYVTSLLKHGPWTFVEPLPLS